MRYVWVVMDNVMPVRFHKSYGDFASGHSATPFTNYKAAERLRFRLRAQYYRIANAAPSAEHEQFTRNAKAAEGVRIIRIDLREVLA